jgi:hypothetical protein
MTRNFNEIDRDKKKTRITLPENAAGLSPEKMAVLENRVRDSLTKDYLPCAIAFKIAEDMGVPVVAVGQVADKIGHRITGCQIGCFKVEKTIRDNVKPEDIDEKVLAEVIALDGRGELTCAAVFDLAGRFRMKPLVVADAANLKQLKIRNCQLGCF